MGIIKTARANATGVNINNTYNQALNAISQVSKSLETLDVQISAMKANSQDFTEEDWKEVQVLRDDIHNKVSELSK